MVATSPGVNTQHHLMTWHVNGKCQTSCVHVLPSRWSPRGVRRARPPSTRPPPSSCSPSASLFHFPFTLCLFEWSSRSSSSTLCPLFSIDFPTSYTPIAVSRPASLSTPPISVSTSACFLICYPLLCLSLSLSRLLTGPSRCYSAHGQLSKSLTIAGFGKRE